MARLLQEARHLRAPVTFTYVASEPRVTPRASPLVPRWPLVQVVPRPGCLHNTVTLPHEATRLQTAHWLVLAKMSV